MFNFIRNLFFPARPTPSPRQQQLNQIPVVQVQEQEVEIDIEVESNRKRKAAAENINCVVNSKRNRHSADSQGTWNLDIEQANFSFSKETLAIFAGAGNTSLVSRKSCTGAYSSASARNFLRRRSRQQDSDRSALGDAGEASSQSVLGQITNLPDFCLPVPTLPTPTQVRSSQAALHRLTLANRQPQQQQRQPWIHSTPLATNLAQSVSRSDKDQAANMADKSTVPKASSSAAAGAAPNVREPAVANDNQALPDDGDDDCVITSIEEPKSVAEIFSPCKYLSPDWLNDIKTSSQSLKSYMQRVETEENLKLQYWAKKREADERDLVARVTRNLKLAERELPVLPYRYEEPPPTPPIEELEEEFPDLTEEQMQLVERAWSRQLPGSEVLAEGFSLRVTREELRSLAGLNWLNDNIVNFYMQLIAARSADQPGLPRVHAFSTFFYTKLSTSGYASVRRWTRKADIFSCDVLLCPVHLHNNHWTLCIVDLCSRHIIYLDSLSMGGGASCLPLMRQYLADEHRDKKGGAELPGLADFQLVRETGAPQQENGSDCGVFTCKFADYYCKQRDFTFSQANMPYFRKRITVEIIEKRLLW